jgi:Uma2 family endonuclease
MSTAAPRRVIYPESDGQPMAENTLQYQWISTIKWGLEALFRHDPQVFVAGDLLWYPVEGDPKIRQAPDALVVFGRPKGHRGSYRQWEEGGVPPQVVFEVLSPGNRGPELVRKHQFYERYGVEEYYVYDPDSGELSGWLRKGDRLLEIPRMEGWVSPRLGVKFGLEGTDLVLTGPDGERFATYLELVEARERLEAEAEAQQHRADLEAQRAEEEKLRAEAERQRAERLAAQLRQLGIEPVQ